MKKVLILYKFLPQYRIEFFDNLRTELLKKNINLTLIYGKLKNRNSSKADERDLEWATYRENKIIKLGGVELIWQPCMDIASKYDLIVVEQANSLLVNYILLLRSKFTSLKFAFWGHGANLQDDLNSPRNRFKYFFVNKVDYWFAYTEGVKKFLLAKKVKDADISVLNNSIDTKTLSQQYESISKSQVDDIKVDLGIDSKNIAIYCGGIYKEKQIDFLLEASKKIKEEVNDFHLLVLGSGPDSYKVTEESKKSNFIHYIGAKFGKERVPYFKMSSLFLMPGLVGLAILDSFATQTPMVTTDYPFHSPEIEYLSNNINGLMTENNLNSFSSEVIKLYKNPIEIDKLKLGCKESSKLYSTENMVKNFVKGVENCLAK